MKLRKKPYPLLGVLIAIGLIYLIFLQYKIIEYSRTDAPRHADYLIILGARVNGTVPTSVFSSRIHTAAIYLKKNKETIVIASGGQGTGEDISEAESIKRELIKQGINSSRIILEDKSTSTYENIRFSKRLIPMHAELGIVVTNKFHMYRTLSIAEDEGLDLTGLPAKTPLIAVGKSYLREYLAITKYYLIKLIS